MIVGMLLMPSEAAMLGSINVDFGHFERGGVLVGQLLDDRRDHPAGPHQGAQKSTNTGWDDWSTSVWKFWSLSSTTLPIHAFSWLG